MAADKPGKSSGKAPDGDAFLSPEEAQLAIARAAEQKPQLQVIREKMSRLTESEQGMQMLANAIRRMLHEER